jgi:hypothetical protein
MLWLTYLVANIQLDPRSDKNYDNDLNFSFQNGSDKERFISKIISNLELECFNLIYIQSHLQTIGISNIARLCLVLTLQIFALAWALCQIWGFCNFIHGEKQLVLFSVVKPIQMHNISNVFYFGTTHYMFRTVFPSITRSLRLYIQHQVYVIQVLWLLASKQ